MSLPKGWVLGKSGELFKIRNGYAFKSKDFLAEGIPLVKQTNLNGDTVDFTKCNYLPIGYLEEYKRFILQKDDVLIGMSGSIGKLCIYDKDFPALQNQRTGKIELISNTNTEWKFIWHYLNTIEKQLKDEAKGNAVANVSATNIENLPLNIPPLNEQKRIAQKLDELLATVENIKTRLDNASTILKRFRQSILSAATSGKLTEEWRETHINVTNVYYELINQKENISLEEYQVKWNNFNVPKTWTCTYLKYLADLRLGKMLDKHKNVGEQVKYLANINVRWFAFELENLKEIKMTSDEKTKLSIVNDDVFICEGGEPGRAAIWKNGTTDITFQKALHRVRFQLPFVSEWLVMNLKTDADSNRLMQLFTGTTIKHFTGRSLAKYPILIPPFEEQKEIVSQVESLFALVDSMEAKIKTAQKHVDKLNQSILAKAFKGELVSQNPTDESAEKLLARIKA